MCQSSQIWKLFCNMVSTWHKKQQVSVHFTYSLRKIQFVFGFNKFINICLKVWGGDVKNTEVIVSDRRSGSGFVQRHRMSVHICIYVGTCRTWNTNIWIPRPALERFFIFFEEVIGTRIKNKFCSILTAALILTQLLVLFWYQGYLSL